jgi:mono/diheme cytochrome c family protein
VAWDGPQEGRFVLNDVYDGLTGIPRGQVKALRVVALPMKTQPQMNSPSLGITNEDPGKIVLGTVPVAADGSAYFRVPSGISVFFQALDADGLAIQTMRTATYVQPGQTLSCIGCHEPRQNAPGNLRTLASRREPSKLTPGPEGSWPLRFDRLVQPVLDRHCVRCHNPKGPKPPARKINLTPAKAYQTLITYGRPNLRDYVRRLEVQPLSPVGHTAARDTPLLGHLTKGKGHQDVKLDPDSLSRLITWMDTYAQRLGHFSDEQERRLLAFRARAAWLAAERE